MNRSLGTKNQFVLRSINITVGTSQNKLVDVPSKIV
jgi:hypothetical protein